MRRDYLQIFLVIYIIYVFICILGWMRMHLKQCKKANGEGGK